MIPTNAPEPAMFDSLEVDALWQTFSRSADFRRALEWASSNEAPGALFVAFRSGLAAALATPPLPVQADRMQTLPQSLINLIGEYGLARTDGVSELERIHRWGLLIEGIKDYARAALASSPAVQAVPIQTQDSGHPAQRFIPDVRSEQAAAAKALEFAEYMAKKAEHLLDAINAEDAVRLRREESDDVDDDTVYDMAVSRGEFVRGLRSGIYEFRKRAEKATSVSENAQQSVRPDVPAQPAQPDERKES